jgi:hypothetical protein
MKRLMISAFAAVALLAVATTMLWSHSPSKARLATSADAMSLQEIHNAANVNKLPIEDVDDQSLVFSKTTR